MVHHRNQKKKGNLGGAILGALIGFLVVIMLLLAFIGAQTLSNEGLLKNSPTTPGTTVTIDPTAPVEISPNEPTESYEEETEEYTGSRLTPESDSFSERESGEKIKLTVPTKRTISNVGVMPGTKVAVIKEAADTYVRFDTCTIAFSLPGKSGLPWSITAGHCGKEGQKVYTSPEGNDFNSARFLGTIRKVSISNAEHGTSDWAAIRLDPYARRPAAPQDIPMMLDSGPREKGTMLCKNGATTGLNCGAKGQDDVMTRLGSFSSDGDVTTGLMNQVSLCALPGDSGSPVFDKDGIVGVLSSTGASAKDVERGACSGSSMAYYIGMDKILKQVRERVKDIKL